SAGLDAVGEPARLLLGRPGRGRARAGVRPRQRGGPGDQDRGRRAAQGRGGRLMAKRRGNIDRAAVFEALLGGIAATGPAPAHAAGPAGPGGAVRARSRRPRRHVAEAGLGERAASIGERGGLEPVLVRRVGGGFGLVAGERRTRAAALAGLDEVPAIVL